MSAYLEKVDAGLKSMAQKHAILSSKMSTINAWSDPQFDQIQRISQLLAELYNAVSNLYEEAK